MIPFFLNDRLFCSIQDKYHYLSKNKLLSANTVGFIICKYSGSKNIPMDESNTVVSAYIL